LRASSESLYLEFENMPVKVIAIRKIPEIETAGLRIQETEPGRELTVSLWVAWELVDADLARLADEGVSVEEWTQIHYRERFQPVGQPSPLPDDFYLKAYLTFKRNYRASESDSSSLGSLDRRKGRFRDILESRIGKIIRLASAEAAVESRFLQKEESKLYNDLYSLVSTWRKEMRELGEG
jgi:hypothetical protein